MDNLRFGIHSAQMFSNFDDCLEIWKRAEDLNFDFACVFDHFRTPDSPNNPCFEGLSLLAGLSAKLNTIRCVMMVLSVTNRHPALVANMVSTIDHISKGRLEIGLGLGADDLAHQEYGFIFPQIEQRAEIFESYCTILDGLLYKNNFSYFDKHFKLENANLMPKPIQKKVPLIIGGGGEKTIKLAARHADIWNVFCNSDIESYIKKIDLLSRECEEIGRNPKDIRKSILFKAIIVENHNELNKIINNGIDSITYEQLQKRGYLLIGTTDQLLQRITELKEIGVGDFVLTVRNQHDIRSMELLASNVIPYL